MDNVVISGVRPYDGSYNLDLENDALTYLEVRWIKQITGYLPHNLDLNDPDVMLAIALIAMVRNRKIDEDDIEQVADKLARAPVEGTIRFEGGTTEDADAGPPDTRSSLSPDSSGPGSKTNSDQSEPDQKNSGTPGSGSLASVPTRLVG